MQILGIDIGGSSVKGAPVDIRTGKLVAERRRIETPRALSPNRMARAVAELADAFAWTGPVGIGFPGVVSGTRILTSDNLHAGFIGCDGVRLFGRAVGGTVSLTNDAAAAAVAEMKFGAGRGFRGKALVLTLGTGIGSAIVYRGLALPCELGQLPWAGVPAEKYVAPSVRAAENLSWREWGGRLGDYLAVLDRLHWPELIILGGGISSEFGRFARYLPRRAKLVPAKFGNDAGIIGAALSAAPEVQVADARESARAAGGRVFLRRLTKTV